MGHKDLKTTMRYIRAVQLQFSEFWTHIGHTRETTAIVWRPSIVDVGRGERIRTSDLSVPNRAHYQAVLRPELTLIESGKLSF